MMLVAQQANCVWASVRHPLNISTCIPTALNTPVMYRLLFITTPSRGIDKINFELVVFFFLTLSA